MIIFGNKRFISAPFIDEAEIEGVVEKHYEDIFGPDSIYIPKKKLYSEEGTGTIPDGFVIDIENRQWFLIEAELAKHQLWSHIAPQVAKQMVAAAQPSTRALLVATVVNMVKEEAAIKQKFESQEIDIIDIAPELHKILEKDPIIGIPIDNIGPDMRQWAQTQRLVVNLWLVRKLIDVQDPGSVIYEVPDDYRPVFNSVQARISQAAGVEQWTADDVTVPMLIDNGLLAVGQELSFSYKQHGATDRTVFTATVSEDKEGLMVNGKGTLSLSSAAVECMRSVGSPQRTRNGWTSWRTADGKLLYHLREELVARLNQNGSTEAVE